jgi:hemerythrin
MKKTIWKDEYRVGHELIDEQHKNIFAIVNRLHSDLPEESFKSELMNLYKHTREHFAEEEKIMRDAHYVYYKEHRGEHDRMLKELNSHVEKVMKDSSQIPLFHEFLSDWVNQHVIKQDLSLSHYLEE